MDADKKSLVIDNLTLLCKRGQELSSINDPDSLLNRILETACEICDSDAASILLLDGETDELYFKTKCEDKEKTENVRKIRFNTNRGIAGWVADNRKPVVVNDISQDPRHYQYLDQIVDYKTKKLICVPVLWKNEVIGIMETLNKNNGYDFTEQDLEYLTILANQAGAALHITGMMQKLHNFFVNMLEIMMMATETLGTHQGHSVRVARLATKIAREMGVSENEYKDIYYASLIHDIGQIKVAKDRLVGGDKLIPRLGADMLKPVKMLRSIARLVENYHERWDGSGTPAGITGEDIPLGSRIIGIAEEYVEWMEEESYRKQFDPFFLDDFFRQVIKTHDPKVVEAFMSIRKKERGDDRERHPIMAEIW